MKLRFRNNSLRFRVNQREVAQLAAGAALEEWISFPGGSLISYVLQPSEQKAADASFHQGIIRVAAPEQQFKDWARNDDIGIYFEFPVDDTLLRIAIEKDLECVDGAPEERDPDAFPRTGTATDGKNCQENLGIIPGDTSFG
jgi:hypothetical protein